jgi:predicted transposase YbfD/YdcC
LEGSYIMSVTENFLTHFINLKDPRKNNHNKRHSLGDILVLTILAVICGADGWVEVEEFGNAKKEWLQTFLELPSGIPSHDTIGDLFARLSLEEFETCFLSWVNSLVKSKDGDIIPIDGKTARGSHNRGIKGDGKSAIHMVSAWSTAHQMVLGQYKTDEKSNEITAIPELLKMLDITGCTVTIDAMGTQKKIAEQIRKQGGDYVLTVKENQGNLHEKIISLFSDAEKIKYESMSYEQDETTGKKNHDRKESRRCTVLPLRYLPEFKLKWEGLASVAMVESMREIKGSMSVEKRYYISSLEPNAEIIGSAIRKHWGIENQLHWCLDVTFREDDCRVRKGNAAGNFSILRHIALNLLKKETTAKVGLKIKRNKAGWDHRYLAKILEGVQL